MNNDQTPEQWAQDQLKAAADALPQCGHKECMTEAVVQLSRGLLARVGNEVPIPSMSTELIMLLASLASAHKRLGEMRELDRLASLGVMQ